MSPKPFTTSTQVSPFATAEVTTKQYKPWLDFDDGKNVLFTSVHLFDNYHNHPGVFYPGTGAESENTPQDDACYPGGIQNVPLPPGECSSAQWRQAFAEKVFPRLQEFKPDFILCSAGFDAHCKDHLHRSGDTGVTEFDYRWLTENLQRIANTHAQGRLVSCFEGGYNVRHWHQSVLAQSVGAHIRALAVTSSSKLIINEKWNEIEKFTREENDRRVLESRELMF